MHNFYRFISNTMIFYIRNTSFIYSKKKQYDGVFIFHHKLFLCKIIGNQVLRNYYLITLIINLKYCFIPSLQFIIDKLL